MFFAIKVRRPSGENPPIYTVLNAAFSAFLAPAGAPWWTPPHRRRQCDIFLQKKFALPDAHKKILKKFSEQLTKEAGIYHLYEISTLIDETMYREKGLMPNVDFYSATVYHSMGIPTDLFTPIFAASRIVGWVAHILEQYQNNRIYRPRARWIGPTGLKSVAIHQRQ